VAEFRPSYLIHGVPGHPLHPPLTDATIGAYTFATIAAILSKLGVAKHGFAQAWWLALLVAIALSSVTILAGLADYLQISRGTELKKTATWHALANSAASVCFVLAAGFGHGGYVDRSVTTGSFLLTLAGFAFLTIGGTMGGSLTYVHGMRVLNLADEPAVKAVAPVPSREKVEAEKG
jgi:uncharacterized membrane protein